MSIIKTTEDGWDCEPKLQQAVNQIEQCDSFIYEIKNCVRSEELDNMVYEMVDFLKEAISTLESIDTDVEYETVENNS